MNITSAVAGALRHSRLIPKWLPPAGTPKYCRGDVVGASRKGERYWEGEVVCELLDGRIRVAFPMGALGMHLFMDVEPERIFLVWRRK